jgi:hypothetical protein
MSFVRPEIAAGFRRWREAVVWAALLVLGLWMVWQGYRALAIVTFVAGLAATATGASLLHAAIRRVRLQGEPGEGVVVIDEARIAYLGPRGGGVVDVPAIVRVEIVTRPYVPPDSAHAWVLTAEDGTRLVIPLGARGADALFDALSPLPGIDFDAGAAAVAAHGPGRATVWDRMSEPRYQRLG